MLETKQFESALRQLASIRRRLRELLEWERFFRTQPKINCEPGFDPAISELRSLRIDLWNNYSFFMNLSFDLREALDKSAKDSSIDADQRERWGRRIDRIERDVAAMRLGERLIKL